MRFIHRMLGHQARLRARPPLPAIPPAPAALPYTERAELAATRRRLGPKWAAMDALIADFERTDRLLHS